MRGFAKQTGVYALVGEACPPKTKLDQLSAGLPAHWPLNFVSAELPAAYNILQTIAIFLGGNSAEKRI